MWQKLSSNSDPKIIAMDDIITSTDERFKARTSIEKNAEGDKMGSTLVIASAEDGDAGNYICQLATGKDPKELKYTVEIRDPPGITKTPSQGLIKATEGIVPLRSIRPVVAAAVESISKSQTTLVTTLFVILIAKCLYL